MKRTAAATLVGLVTLLAVLQVEYASAQSCFNADEFECCNGQSLYIWKCKCKCEYTNTQTHKHTNTNHHILSCTIAHAHSLTYLCCHYNNHKQQEHAYLEATLVTAIVIAQTVQMNRLTWAACQCVSIRIHVCARARMHIFKYVLCVISVL